MLYISLSAVSITKVNNSNKTWIKHIEYAESEFRSFEFVLCKFIFFSLEPTRPAEDFWSIEISIRWWFSSLDREVQSLKFVFQTLKFVHILPVVIILRKYFDWSTCRSDLDRSFKISTGTRPNPTRLVDRRLSDLTGSISGIYGGCILLFGGCITRVKYKR